MTLRRRESVVFGPYPPMRGPASEATLGDVRRLLASGADVRVISPERSAAHGDADLSRPGGALRFARQAIGTDQLVLRLDADLLTSKANREELPARLAVAAALRSARRSTVHLPHAVTLPAAWSRALAPADDVVVGNQGGVDGVAIGVSGPAPVATDVPSEPHQVWNLPPEPTRQELEAEIHRRAAERRAARRGAGAAQAGPRSATRTIRTLPLLESEPPDSTRFAVEAVKRVVGRLTNWRINPLTERVNLLHRALLEAVDQDPGRGEAGRG